MPMTEDAKLAEVREFLGALSPSELRRVVELFRMRLGLPGMPDNVAPILTSGIERPHPGIAAVAGAR